MTNDPLYNRLLELSWQRKLTGSEEAELRAWLVTHPEAQADWEAEAGLSEALSRLPDVPVASNFTARVLQTVGRDAAAESGRPRSSWRVWEWPLRWLPRVSFAALALTVGLLSYHHVRVDQQKKLVRSVAVVSEVFSPSSPKILEDFDAICAMSPTPPADEQLLALLK